MTELITKSIILEISEGLGTIQTQLFFGKLGAIAASNKVSFLPDVVKIDSSGNDLPADPKDNTMHGRVRITLVSKSQENIDNLLSRHHWKSNSKIKLIM